MSGYRPARSNDKLAACVSGRNAKLILALLPIETVAARTAGMPDREAREDLLATFDAFRKMALEWDRERLEATGGAAQSQPALHAPAVEAREAAPGPAGDQITAVDAAARLGCSERRVRQLLTEERLSGRRFAGRWFVDADSVEGYLLARHVA
ncbi:hypothetical protein ACIQCM_08755 [Pseudarthrobacter sp. NPDC092439]|uniref:hypothetical protein n=1 Tax=unclassified Pseudarthrobacter TaxID=2647000 RepID=UPI0038108EEC